MTQDIVIIVISLLLSAFFSGMEIAYISSDKVMLSLENKEDSLSGRALRYLMKRPTRFISAMLIGNNITIVVYGFYAGRLIMSLLFPQYSGTTHFPIWILLVQTLISTAVVLITGEFLPKAVFRSFSAELMRFFAIPVYLIYKLISFTLLIDVMLWISNFFIVKVFHGQKSDLVPLAFGWGELENYISEQMENLDREQIEEMDSEIHIFRAALEFPDVKARECMVPRTEIQALEAGQSVEELRQLFIETGLSKIIIYRDNIDNVQGYIHSFELFRPQATINELIMPVEFVPETMPINEVLNTLTKKKMSVAIVVDEYGGTAGILTVEDIVEEIVGDIEDEHDRDTLVEEKTGPDRYRFSARLEVDYLNKEYQLNLPESDEYETLGGMIINRTESIPDEGEVVNIDCFEIKIESVSETRIETVSVKVKKEE